MGPDFLIFHDEFTPYRVSHFFQLSGAISFEFAIIYIVLKYLLLNQKTWLRYLIAVAVLIPVVWLNFKPYLLNPNYMFQFEPTTLYYPDIAARLLRNHGLTFVYMVVYGIFLYRTGRVLGVYINLLMASLFVFLTLEMVQFSFIDRQLRLEIFSGSILSLNLVILAGILAKKFLFNCSEYGQFYESLIQNKFKMGKVKILAYRSESNATLFRALKLYIAQRSNYLVFILIIFIVSFIVLKVPAYLTVILSVLAGSVIVILLYINALHKKRADI